jgi:Tol biopolymer transport system component
VAELSPDNWAEVKRLFIAAADLPPQELPDYLRRECPDRDIRREVSSLLDDSGEELASADAAIASAAAAVSTEKAPNPDERLIGTRLGPYRVDAIAGHGGMGAVYRASRDDAEFHQRVAIKLVRAAAESPDALRRFRQERQILAGLSHPNIARLLDGGSTSEGVPYLVMEFIDGEPITAWCEQHSLSLEERLRLFLRVCEGVEFAHRGLVVHRDLKPANILVAKDGTPKLLDFGIAKLLDPDEDSEVATLSGLMMTPEYASPERVRGDSPSITADVYSLGLILYELLTGTKAQPVAAYTPDAIITAVIRTEPASPSLLNPKLAGDLDHIIRMAIRKEPERRYASAGYLARDIQRHLEGRPVMARPDTVGYRAGKFVRRNRIAVAVGLVIGCSLAGGFALEYWLGAFARPPRVSQVEQLTQTGRVDVASGVVTDSAQIYFTELTGGQSSLAEVSVKGGIPALIKMTPALFQPDIMDISPDRSSLLVAGGPGEGYNRPLWILPITGGTPRRLRDVIGGAAAWSHDGKRIVFSRGSALFRVNIDGTDCRKILDTPHAVGDAIRWAPTAAADVLRLAIHDDITPSALWEMAPNGSGLHRLLPAPESGTGPENDYGGSWTSFGRYYLFLRSGVGNASLWAMNETRDWRRASRPQPVQIYSSPLQFLSLAPSVDGKRVFLAGGLERRELVRYEASRDAFTPYLSGVAGRWIDTSRDERWVVYTMAADGGLWRSRPDGTERARLGSTSLHAAHPRWSPDGTKLVFSGVSGGEFGLYVLDVNGSGGASPERISSPPSIGLEPNWSPDGNSVLFGAGTPPASTLYVMNLKTRKSEAVPGSEGLSRPSWSPDPRYIAATNWQGSEIRLFDFHSRVWTPLVGGVAMGPPFWSHDGKYVYYQDAFAEADQPVFRVRIADRKSERVVSSRQLLQSNVTGYTFAGLAPGDAPVASLIRSNSDLYALDLDLP